MRFERNAGTTPVLMGLASGPRGVTVAAWDLRLPCPRVPWALAGSPLWNSTP